MANVDKVAAAQTEADFVELMVEGRPMVNAGTRMVNAAKGFFTRSGKKSWKGKSFLIKLEAGTRAGFDLEAFKAAHPKIYAKFYRTDMPCVNYKVENIG